MSGAPIWVKPSTLVALLCVVVACGPSRDEPGVDSIDGIDSRPISRSTPAPALSAGPPRNTVPDPAGASGSGDQLVPGTVTTVPRPHPQPLEPQGNDFAGAFGTFVGGGDTEPDCAGEWATAPSEPYIGPGDGTLGTLTRGLDLQICIAGFDPSETITLTVVNPSGQERVLSVSAGPTDIGPTDLLVEATGEVSLQALEDHLATHVGQLDPVTPLGQYQLTARQGDVETTVNPTVEPYPVHASDGGWLKPQGNLATQPERRPGETIRILLLGFDANSTVPLAIYRPEGPAPEGGEFTFLRQLRDAHVNAEGWAYHDVVIPADLPPMTQHPGYCIVTHPALAPSYCQPSRDPLFTISGDPPQTAATANTDVPTAVETTTTATPTSVEATSTTPPSATEPTTEPSTSTAGT